MENVNQDHGRNHQNRYDQNRRDVDREANNRENQNSQIQDPDNFDIQAQYNEKQRSHFEGDKLRNSNNPEINEAGNRSSKEHRNPTPDENNPTPNRRSNQEQEKGDNRHNL